MSDPVCQLFMLINSEIDPFDLLKHKTIKQNLILVQWLSEPLIKALTDRIQVQLIINESKLETEHILMTNNSIID